MVTSATLFDTAYIDGLETLSAKQRIELVEKLWPKPSPSWNHFDNNACIALLQFISNELRKLRYRGRFFAAQNLDQTLDIIQVLRNKTSVPFGILMSEVQSSFPDSSMKEIRRSIELAARMWLTINIHSSEIFVGSISAGDRPLNWTNDMSLEQLIRREFGRHITLQCSKNMPKFDPILTAAYLVNVCGMRICWSDDMATHLHFNPKTSVLSVYRHRACLLGHLAEQGRSPIPVEVLEEILDTMDLLFPPWDATTQQLLQKEGQQSLFTLGCHTGSRNLDLTRYQYFGEALEGLLETFDKTPQTWKQLAFDRRNKLEWSAFWVTVMVAVLTLITIPCNIIQATYSIKAYHATLAQAQFPPPR